MGVLTHARPPWELGDTSQGNNTRRRKRPWISKFGFSCPIRKGHFQLVNFSLPKMLFEWKDCLQRVGMLSSTCQPPWRQCHCFHCCGCCICDCHFCFIGRLSTDPAQPPTPHYNMSVLEDSLLESHFRLCHVFFADLPVRTLCVSFLP